MYIVRVVNIKKFGYIFYLQKKLAKEILQRTYLVTLQIY